MFLYQVIKMLILMHRKLLIFTLLFLFSALCLTTSSCSPRYGCPSVESAKTNKKGELSTKPGKSQLFPKSTRKKMKH